MHELKLMDVQKKYKDKEAVRKFNYTFANGVYGLLGENGAGKTTLMRLICGVLQPTEGSIYCDNIETASMGAEYRRLLGYLPQDFGYYGDFTAERFLRYMAALKALPEDYAKKYQYNWIKIIVILFVIVFLISTLCQEIDIIAQALKFNLPETLIIGFVIISLFIYIPLTECVIDEVKFYRVKSIASIVQFLILLVIYITSMMDMSSDDVGNIYDIMIFAIGQIAFAESAISNYKSMYKKLKEEKKDEVEKYLEGVDKQYEKNEEMIRSDIKEAKNFVGEIVDLWSKMNWKQRIKVVGVLLAFIGFYVLLIWISTLLSNI